MGSAFCVKYRLYTERKNEEKVMAMAKEFLPGFTVTFGRGMWQGQEEDCMVLEFADFNGGFRNAFFALAERIKVLNEQEMVMVTEEEVRLTFA